mgnify:CR=1 FL=1
MKDLGGGGVVLLIHSSIEAGVKHAEEPPISIVLMPAYTPGVLWFLRLPRTPLSVWRDLKPAVARLALARVNNLLGKQN